MKRNEIMALQVDVRTEPEQQPTPDLEALRVQDNAQGYMDHIGVSLKRAQTKLNDQQWTAFCASLSEAISLLMSARDVARHYQYELTQRERPKRRVLPFVARKRSTRRSR